MDGIEKITRQIIAEAEAECSSIAADAAAKCAQITAEYEKKAEEVYSTAVKAGTADIETDAMHVERNARLTARKNILAAKQDMVDKAFELAGKKLRGMGDDKYITWLAEIAADASVTGDELLVLDEGDDGISASLIEKANSLLAAKGKKAELRPGISEKNVGAGFILRRGDITVNCTVAEMMAVSRKEIASEVASKLFG